MEVLFTLHASTRHLKLLDFLACVCVDGQLKFDEFVAFFEMDQAKEISTHKKQEEEASRVSVNAHHQQGLAPNRRGSFGDLTGMDQSR